MSYLGYVLLLHLAEYLLACCCSSQVKVWQGGELVYPGQECEDLLTTQPPLLVTFRNIIFKRLQCFLVPGVPDPPERGVAGVLPGLHAAAGLLQAQRHLPQLEEHQEDRDGAALLSCWQWGPVTLALTSTS